MIFATLRVKVSPKRLGDTQEIMHSILSSIKAEPGCISCRFYQNMHSPEDILMITDWKSEDYLDRYIAEDEYRKFLALIDLSEEPPEVKFHKVSQVSGMERIATIRLGEASK